MADACTWRNDAHIVETLLRPFQEVVTFLVTREFPLHIAFERARTTGNVGDDGMVDDQVAGNLRVDLARIAPQIGTRFAHDGKIDENGHSGEVLEQDAGRAEFHFFAHCPRASCLHNASSKLARLIRILHVTQNVFKKNLESVRQLRASLYCRYGEVRIRLIIYL